MPTYIRVRSTSTGHEYDCDERALRPGMEPIPGYPPNTGPGARPRPAKHRVDKAGRPARRRTTPDPASPPPSEGALS
jgi:hypothetical protein